ncbi:MAG: AAA family ATPase, partial [Bacilli bacterium]|nr:AAA family ATPase [Bacilli bacterium]
MRYLDKIKTLPNTDANNALILGTVMHEGIENGVEAAIKAYYDSFPIIDDLHINEAIKLEYWIPKVKELLPDGEYELQITNHDFIGYVDLLTENEDGTFDIYDFKYSNNVKNYMGSDQLHLYKYFIDEKIDSLYYVFIPKISIRQKKTEDLYAFRKRLQSELEKSNNVKIVKVDFNYEKIIEFYQGVKRILETKDFPKEPNYLCNWCEYQKFCEEGEDYMLLPKNERRNIEKIDKRVIWIYGAPFTGKTTFANDFPDLLMLNTDGNIKFVDAPYIAIKDIVTVEGRMTKRKLAWEVFKEAIDELEKKENDFKSITLDLVEDCYEYCRLYMYDKLNISHESDDSFSAWDKVRTEFLSTM